MEEEITTTAEQVRLSEGDKQLIKAALAELASKSGIMGLNKNAEDLVEAFRMVNES